MATSDIPSPSPADPQTALAERALKALAGEDPREARKLLFEAVEAAPDRPDLLNALGVVHLQLGEPELGKPLIEQAIAALAAEVVLHPERKVQAETMIEGFQLSLAAACEDLDLPGEAEAAYKRVLLASPGTPRAQQGLAHLYFAWGQLDAARRELSRYVEEERDEAPFLEGAEAYLADVTRFVREDIHPREFLNAHRGSYVEMFDHYAAEQAGWIAEAARMKRAPDGRIVPIIPEGARPYAAVRVDLVNPNTSEIGQVGDQPMVVALADYQALARASALFAWRERAFDVRVSSQCPWDQLPVQILFEGPGAIEDADAIMGDWYMAGWDGAWGTKDGGRMHYISDPDVRRDGRAVVYHVDMGRAAVAAVEDLLRRLEGLHGTHRIKQVILGRGYLA
ncbi:MAG: tetratricopeptide repeat protein [Pseudomonadota bacterium]|nr:tetratricopeptide repeat protein [Pseudomonadota bacterium]